MQTDYIAQLRDKAQREYDGFVESLKQMPSAQVLEHAYEKVMKEELVSCICSTELSQKEAKALCQMHNPLQELYQEWLHNDFSYMDLLKETITDRAESAVKAHKESCRGSR